MTKCLEIIDRAFAKQQNLKKRAYSAIAENPKLESLFVDIATFIQDLDPVGISQSNGVGQSSKKRKLEETQDDELQGTGPDSELLLPWDSGSYRTIKDLSFSIPLRKKLTLETGLDQNQGLRLRDPLSTRVELELLWKDIQHVICLPVPEKAQAQYSFCIFPVQGDGLIASSDGSQTAQQMLWTVPNTAPKPGTFEPEVIGEAGEPSKIILQRLLNKHLKSFDKEVIEPDKKDFVSQTVQAYRKGEKAVHVKTFRGSKDGFLFFLPTGIAWVFKKPLTFFAFDSIDSVSYTSVLQRTFNLNITTRTSSDDTQEFEFSMIDQADFAGIDTYIKRHRLQDASMADERRAKKLNINGVKGTNGALEPEDEEGHLEKATREAEDLEDEEEEEDENFDPGSDGESEGSGSSSEEEDGGDGGDGGRDGDLVQEELGSEAEEIEED